MNLQVQNKARQGECIAHPPDVSIEAVLGSRFVRFSHGYSSSDPD